MGRIELFPSQQMLQYVSGDATSFVQSSVKMSARRLLLSWSARWRRCWVGRRTWRQTRRCQRWSHLECVVRSPFSLPLCQCNAQSVLRGGGKKTGKKKKDEENKKVSQDKNVGGAPRGCFGNNVRSRPRDLFSIFFTYPWLTSGLSLVSPQRSPLICPSVSHVSLTWPPPQICDYR